MKQFISSAILFWALIFTQTLYARVYYVNAGSAGSPVNGLTWPTAFTKIEDAIAIAVDGDEIWVAKGTYAPTVDAGYYINKAISIYGDFAGNETSIYARNLELNKTVVNSKVDGMGGTHNVFMIEQNKAIVLNGLDITLFGVGILSSNVNTLQAGDRFKLTLNNVNFYNGSCPLSMSHHTDLLVENSTYKNNNSTMNVNENESLNDGYDFSKIILKNVLFEGQNGLLYYTGGQLEATNCSFSSFSSLLFPTYKSKKISLQGCTFKNFNDPICSSSEKNIIVDNCVFDNFTEGPLFYQNDAEIFKISNSTFKNSSSFYQLFNCKNMELDHVSFLNLAVINQGIISNGTLKITNSTVDGMSVNGENSYATFIQASSDVEVDNMIFKNSSVSFIQQSQDSSVHEINNSIFENNTISPTSQQLSFFDIKGSLLLNNTQFLNNVFRRTNMGYNQGLITVGSASGSVVVTNSTFKNNITNSVSGVLYISAPSLKIDKCIFENNLSEFLFGYTNNGTGVLYYNASNTEENKITNSSFINNAGSNYGVAYLQGKDQTFENCLFQKNKATFNARGNYGGGSLTGGIGMTSIAYPYIGGTLKLKKCSFIENTSDLDAGALYVFNVSGLSIDQSVFKNNTSKDGSSAIATVNANVSIYNTLFESNQTQSSTMGTLNYIFNSNSNGNNTPGTCEIYNSTFVKNTSIAGPSVLTCASPTKISNSIFWNNGTNIPITATGITPVISNCDIQGSFAGTAVLDTDPKFVDFIGGNYRLSCQSPLINKGNNSLGISLFDLDGSQRIYADTIDMGAYETHIDPALANVIPAPAFTVPARSCKGESVQLLNTTANSGNYTYRWNFGNGQASSQFAPVYAFDQPGQYTIQLTASNFCGQSNTASTQILVRANNAPTITTVSVVCPAAEETYTTNAVCQNIVWTVTGGAIQSGQGTKTIKVLWGNGAAGNGKITLLATGCGVDACEIPVSVEVPIVPVNFSLMGPDKVCQGSFAHYETIIKDKSPATLYTWNVKGGSINSSSNKGYNLTDIDVAWNTSGTDGVVYLTTYNELLKCGRLDSFNVILRPTYKITGNAEVCANTSVAYQVSPGIGSINWQVTGTGNTVSGSTTGTIAWGNAGIYKITAVPQDLSQACNTQDTFLVHVNAKPVITGISGETEVAANSIDVYTGQVNTAINDIDFQWTSPGATILSSYLNTVTLLRNSFSPDNISLTVSSKKGTCTSDPFVLQVKKLFDYTITGIDSVCVGTSTNYTVNENSAQPAVYSWTNVQDGTSYTGSTISPTFNYAGSQLLLLKISVNGKEVIVRKYVYVKATRSEISIEGPAVIDPAGLQVAVYTIKKPANASYAIKIVGGTQQSKTGDQITVKWGGAEPFSIQVQDIFSTPKCNGAPVMLNVRKAAQLNNGIVVGGPACLNSRIEYAFKSDEFTKNISWNLNGGGTVTSSSQNAVTVEWNQTGSHTLTLTYERFGIQTIQLPVVVNALPSPVINTGTICGSDIFNLSTTQNYVRYNWYLKDSNIPFSTQSNPAVVTEGLYTATVTDNNGCVNSDSRYIKQLPLPKAKIFTLDNTVFCTAAGLSNTKLSTFEGQDYKYQWYENNTEISGATTFNFQVAKPLNQENYYAYKVKVSLENCVQYSEVKNIVVKACPTGGGNSGGGTGSGGIGVCTDPAISFSVDQTSLCQPFKFIVDPAGTTGAGLGWDFGDGTTASGLNPAKAYVNADPGAYNVQLTKGCRYYTTPVKVLARALFKLDQPGCIGTELIFNELSVNYPGYSIKKWIWNFGDSPTDETFTGTGDRNGKHTYISSGTYTVTLTVYATNDQGQECSFTTKNTYEINKLPLADYIVDAPSCTGNTYRFVQKSNFGENGNGPVKWTFSNGKTSVNDTTLQQFSAGSHTAQLKITDRLGCTSTKSTSFTVSAPTPVGKITTPVKDTLICNGKTVTLTSPVTFNGTTYEWRKAGSPAVLGTAQTYAVSSAGEYTVTYSPTLSCKGTTAPVKVNSFSVPNIISGEKLNCIGGVLTIKSNLDQPGYLYAWKFKTDTLPNKSGDLVINNITAAAAGDYQLTVTQAATGCYVTLPVYTIQVNANPAKPDIKAAASNICYNAATVLNVPVNKTGKTVSWYQNTIKLNTAADTVFTTGALTNDAYYSVTVKDNATGCATSSDNLTIKVAPLIPVIITGDTSLCEQVSSELVSSYDAKDFSFQWYKNDQPTGGNFSKLNFQNVVKADSGIYKLRVTSKGTTNLAGCTAVSNTKTINVKSTAATPVITGVNEFCSGSSITLTTNLAADFVWNTGASTPSVAISSGGIYSVTSTNVASGCKVTASKTVIQNPVPDLNFVPSGEYARCGTNKIAFEGLNAYPVTKWYINGQLFSTNKIIYPTQSGKYTISATTAKGCTNISDTMLINAQECACYVTNINDTGDGSLREAIACSNDKPGKDVIKFAIPGTGPFVIKPVTALPALTDSVFIDGFSQGGIDIYHIVLDGSGTSTNGLILQDKLAHVKISGLTFRNFTTGIDLASNTVHNTIEKNIFTDNTNTGVLLNVNAGTNTIRNNQFNGGGSGIQVAVRSKNNLIESNKIANAVNGIEFKGGTKNIVRSNTISGSSQNGILLQNAVSNALISNTIGTSLNNGILLATGSDSTHIHSNYIGVTNAGVSAANQQNGIYVAPNVRYSLLDSNTLSGNIFSGLAIEGQQTRIQNNFIGTDASAAILPNKLFGIYASGDSVLVTGNTVANNIKYGISVNNASFVINNTFKNNTSGGIYAVGTKNAFSKNVITNTNENVKAIDLHVSISPVGNTNKQPAVFKSYRRSASGGITIRGTSISGDTIEIFYNNDTPEQAVLFAGSTRADASGNWEIEIPQGAAFNPDSKNFYVNTARTPSNNTSELSAPFLTGCFTCICSVKNTNDSGVESLRATIDKANAGECLLINFTFPLPDTIRLLSAVNPILVPVAIAGPPSAAPDPMIFIKGSNTFNGLVADNEGISISNLGFTSFKQAIVLNSDYGVVRNATITKTTRPLTIAGNHAQVFSSAINTTRTNEANTFKADTLIYITGNDNQIGGTDVENKIIHGKTGVLVNGGTLNSILNNAIYDNAKAISLVNNGNTNYAQPANMLGSITGSTGRIEGTAKPFDKIQIFSSRYTPEQALAFVVEVVADNLGNWAATIPAADIQINQNNYFVATATSNTGNTSQLSAPIRVGNFVQVCYVTNTNDTGEGSLREAVNCANIAGSDPNGLAARIEFQLPAAPNVITLMSGLTITNKYGVEVNARKIPVTVKAGNAALNGFTWTTENLIVRNLTFENFAYALNGSGNNAIVDSNNFVNNKNAVYNNAADAGKQIAITNNYFAGGTSSINSDKGSVTISGNVFGTNKDGISVPIAGFAVAANNAALVKINNNIFSSVSKSAAVTTPAAANGYVISIENASSAISGNTIKGESNTQLPAIRLVNNTQSIVSANTISGAYEGIVVDNSTSVTVTQNTFKAITHRGINLIKSTNIKVTQNTVIGLAVDKKPIDLNLATADVSNNSKATPVILTSTYHDGKLFLIGQTEKFDEVEVFYSNIGQRDLVKYIQTSTADSTGTWIVSFPISATGSDTLFFRAVATKTGMQSSEASVAFTPKLKICLVTIKDDDGVGSLREAIDKANANVCNLIQFAIPVSGVAEIRTVSELPAITAPLLIIDGTSQTGYRKGSPTVNLINTAMVGFNGQGGNQLDVYGMKITGFTTAINILNSRIVNTNDNSIESMDTGINIKTSAFTYGTIENNTIKSVNTGINLDGTAKMFITANRITDFSNEGIRTTGNNQKILTNKILAGNHTTSVGIAVAGSSGMFIQGDTIINAGIGLRINGGSGNEISSNIIGKTDAVSKAGNYQITECGVQVNGSNNCSVSLNTISVIKKSIALTASKGYLVYYNTSGKSETGIYLSNSSSGRIANNTIDSSAAGMQFDASHGVVVYNNLITRSLEYGVLLNPGSDTCRFNANLIGARYLGDTTYAEGGGMLIRSSNNIIGNSPIEGNGNYIKQNKKGGITVDGGKKNNITYNFFYNNDITKGKPTAYAIELIHAGNNEKPKPTITSHKWIANKLHVYGTDNTIAGDSIHLYSGTGGYEEVSKFIGAATSAAGGTWEVIIDTAVTKLPKKTTLYLVATALDVNKNTSPLSAMYILGDCYVTSLKDTADNDYPLPNTLRMAMKCANGQANPVGVYFNVTSGGAKEVKLQMKMLTLDNRFGVFFNGQNIPDGVIAGMNAQKLSSAAWTISATNAASSITKFEITNSTDGLEVLSDSILVQKLRFDKITATALLASNKRIVIDSCVFDSATVGIKPSSAAVNTKINGNTFNQTTTGVVIQNADSITVSSSTFNTGVNTGIDINQSVAATIESNTFSSSVATSKAITWDNARGSIQGNIISAHFVQNPVSISNSTHVTVAGNTFKDSADVYLSLSNASNVLITLNDFVVSNQNSIKTDQVQHTSIIGNYVQQARNDAFNLIRSSTVFVSRNIVNNVRYTSKTDSALCINIHKGEDATQSNGGKEEPKNLKYEVKAGTDRRIGIFVNGLATPGDSIELFLSDTISASMRTFLVKAYTQPDGRWEVKIPRKFYYNDTTTWYHVIAVAIDADSNTSQTSSVLDIPPSPTKIYVLNEYNAGPNSLRQALLDVNNSDIYAQVIFSINLPEIKEGPYNIRIDSLFDPVYSYNGFKMDGHTQIENIGLGEDQRILVNGKNIGTAFGLDITDSSAVCTIKNMWMTNARNGLRLQNNSNQIERFSFINTDSSGTAQLDTAIHIVKKSDESKLKYIFIAGYKLGVLIEGAGKNEFTESIIDSTQTGMILKDSTNNSLISKNTFTNSTVASIQIDHAAGDNKVDRNIFGQESKAVKGNVIIINNSNNQNVVNNRISWFDKEDTLSSPSTAITIQGSSTRNYVYGNRIGLDSSGKTVHTSDVRGILIQKTVNGTPLANSIIGNEINGTNAGAIHAYHSSQDLISENIIGGDSTKKIFGFDSTGIFISDCSNENISDNTILGFSKYGIELLTSDNIQMHRNSLYSHVTKNKAINIHTSNNGIPVPAVTGGQLVDINTIKVTGTAQANTIVEVYRSVKDTAHAVSYINKVSASAAGTWELAVPREHFTYSARNSFTAQMHDGTRSSELSDPFTPVPALCQLDSDPDIKVIEPLYRPCPGPEFKIDPDLDPELTFSWKAALWTDSLITKTISVKDTTKDLTLHAFDTLGCRLARTTNVIFRAKPSEPDLIISSNVFVGDTIVMVDISMPKTVPDTVRWFSSAGVTVLRSSTTSKDSLIGDDGLIYPKGVRYIQFVLPDSGTYSIRQTSIREGCFVEQTKTLLAVPKDPNSKNPYFIAPIIESMYAYPNPSIKGKDDVYINITVATKDEITLMLYTEEGVAVGSVQLSGSLTYDKKLFSNGADHLFENNLASGVYILKLATAANNQVAFKIIIE